MEFPNKISVSCGTKFHSDYLADQLHQRGLLNQVITAHLPQKYLGRTALPRKKVLFLPPFFTLNVLLSRYLKLKNRRLLRWVDVFSIYCFDAVASLLGRKSSIYIGWAWSSLWQMQKAKRQNSLLILEKCGSYGYYQRDLLQAEYQRLNLAFEDPSPEILLRREARECALADYILCPSQHVAQSLLNYGYPSHKLIINPYGANLDRFHPVPKTDKVFRVVCVGTIGVRKGSIYLLEAIKNLQEQGIPVECLLIGSVEKAFEGHFSAYRSRVQYLPRVEQAELKYHYSQGSVFVLPSLDEGMAYVQLEAMACGLPLICTKNSGGESIVEEGQNGFVIEAHSVEAIVEKLLLLYSQPQLILKMRSSALEKIKSFTWDAYGERLVEALKKV